LTRMAPEPACAFGSPSGETDETVSRHAGSASASVTALRAPILAIFYIGAPHGTLAVESALEAGECIPLSQARVLLGSLQDHQEKELRSST
jgi:hypothetical protein